MCRRITASETVTRHRGSVADWENRCPRFIAYDASCTCTGTIHFRVKVDVMRSCIKFDNTRVQERHIQEPRRRTGVMCKGTSAFHREPGDKPISDLTLVAVSVLSFLRHYWFDNTENL